MQQHMGCTDSGEQWDEGLCLVLMRDCGARCATDPATTWTGATLQTGYLRASLCYRWCWSGLLETLVLLLMHCNGTTCATSTCVGSQDVGKDLWAWGSERASELPELAVCCTVCCTVCLQDLSLHGVPAHFILVTHCCAQRATCHEEEQHSATLRGSRVMP